jgi:hypothetical protein
VETVRVVRGRDGLKGGGLLGSEGQGRKENACGEGSSGEGEEEEEAEE